VKVKRFGGTFRLHLQGRRISKVRNQHEGTRKHNFDRRLLNLRFLLSLLFDSEAGGFMFLRRRLVFTGLNDVMSQNVEYFMATALRTSNPTQFLKMLICIYCNLQTCYWVTTSKQTTKQHSPLGNRFLISKYTQLLLSNAFANKHVPTETTGLQQ
jgi:hypothetical protein